MEDFLFLEELLKTVLHLLYDTFPNMSFLSSMSTEYYSNSNVHFIVCCRIIHNRGHLRSLLPRIFMEWSGSSVTFIEVIELILHCGSLLRTLNLVISFLLIRYRILGQPRRHLLTTGWTNFVSQKILVSGDAVLFLRYI